MIRSYVASLVTGVLIGAAPAPITMHMIGDSTMAERQNPATNPERGWGMAFQPFFDDQVVVRNHALNGRSTKSFIDEGHWNAALAELRAGDFVIIEFGHNDEKKEDSTRYTDAATTFRENLTRFVKESRAKGATPILLTPIVRRKFSSGGVLQPTHGAYPDAVRAVAASLDVPLIDLESLTATLVQDAGVEGSKKLYDYTAPGEFAMYPDGHQDDTHLNQAGAEAVAKLAAVGLKGRVPGLAEHIRL